MHGEFTDELSRAIKEYSNGMKDKKDVREMAEKVLNKWGEYKKQKNSLPENHISLKDKHIEFLEWLREFLRNKDDGGGLTLMWNDNTEEYAQITEYSFVGNILGEGSYHKKNKETLNKLKSEYIESWKINN